MGHLAVKHLSYFVICGDEYGEKGDVPFWVAGPRITSAIADNAQRAAANAAWPHWWFS